MLMFRDGAAVFASGISSRKTTFSASQLAPPTWRTQTSAVLLKWWPWTFISDCPGLHSCCGRNFACSIGVSASQTLPLLFVGPLPVAPTSSLRLVGPSSPCLCLRILTGSHCLQARLIPFQRVLRDCSLPLCDLGSPCHPRICLLFPWNPGRPSIWTLLMPPAGTPLRLLLFPHQRRLLLTLASTRPTSDLRIWDPCKL